MTGGLRKLTLLAVAGGCGGGSAPASLHGPLAFPVVVVDVETSPLVNNQPDAGWDVDLDVQSTCGITDGPLQTMKLVDLQIWSPDGGPYATGKFSVIDPDADLVAGSAILYYRDLTGSTASGPGVGGSVTLTEAGPAYAGSFVTTINGQSLSGTFSTAGQSQCACTTLPNGATECPEY